MSQHSDTTRKYPSLNKLFNFVRAPNGRLNASCKFCPKVAGSCKAVRLIQHSLNCEKSKSKYVNELRRDMEKANEKDRRDPNYKQKIIRLIVDLIAVNSLPLSFADSAGFRDFMHLIDPTIKIPGRHALTYTHVPNRAKEIHQGNLTLLSAQSKYSLTLEFDGWTSKGNVCILSVVVTDEAGRSTLIDLIDITGEKHDADVISNHIITTMRESGLKSNLFNCMVTDGAGNYNLARGLVKKKVKHLIEYRCLAHVGNLVGATICKHPSVKPIILQLIKFINHVNRCKRLAYELKKRHLHRLTHIVPTRWYSTANAINSAINIREGLRSIGDCPGMAFDKWGETLQDHNFWDCLGHLKILFDRISSFIGLCERPDSKLSDCFRCFLELGRFFHAEVTDNRYKAIAEDCFYLHLGRLNCQLLITAYVLDPNHRADFITSSGLIEAKAYSLSIIVDTRAESNEKVGRTAAISYAAEFDDYIDCIRSIRHFITDVKTWWVDSNFGHLREIGIRLAACHGSSANTERIFSGLNHIITSTRNALNTQTLFELMTIKIHQMSLDNESRPKGASEPPRASQPSQPSQPSQLPTTSAIATTSQASERSRSPNSTDDGENSDEEDFTADYGLSILDTVELNEADELIAGANSNINNGRTLFTKWINYDITSECFERPAVDTQEEEDEEEQEDSITRSRRLLGLI